MPAVAVAVAGPTHKDLTGSWAAHAHTDVAMQLIGLLLDACAGQHGAGQHQGSSSGHGAASPASPPCFSAPGSAAAIRASKGLGGFIVQRAHSVEQITTKETQQLQQHIGTVARNSTGCATCPPPTCFKQPIYSPAQQRLWEANAAGCTAAAEAKVFELQPCDATGVLPGLTMNAAAQAGAAEQEEVSAASVLRSAFASPRSPEVNGHATSGRKRPKRSCSSDVGHHHTEVDRSLLGAVGLRGSPAAKRGKAYNPTFVPPSGLRR